MQGRVPLQQNDSTRQIERYIHALERISDALIELSDAYTEVNRESRILLEMECKHQWYNLQNMINTNLHVLDRRNVTYFTQLAGMLERELRVMRKETMERERQQKDVEI